jgi:hypothetical protein
VLPAIYKIIYYLQRIPTTIINSTIIPTTITTIILHKALQLAE